MGLSDHINRVKASFSAQNAPAPEYDARGARCLIVYLFEGIGDAVLLAPAVQALLDAGAERVDLLMPRRARAMYHTIDQPVGLVELEQHEDDLSCSLSMAAYDYAIDMSHRDGLDARRWLLATTKIGWIGAHETAESAGLAWGVLDKRAQTDRLWLHRQLDLLRPFGVGEPEPVLRFSLGRAAPRFAERLFEASPRLVVIPGASAMHRRWPLEKFEAAIRAIDVGSIVVVGAPSERAELRTLARRLGASSYSGADLKRMVAIVASADVVLSNDTGPLQVAYLCGRPAVGIYAYMSPAVWGPPSGRADQIALPGTTSVDAVVDAMQSLLSSTSS